MGRLERDQPPEELVVLGIREFGGVLPVVQLVRPVHVGRQRRVQRGGLVRRERGGLLDQGRDPRAATRWSCLRG